RRLPARARQGAAPRRKARPQARPHAQRPRKRAGARGRGLLLTDAPVSLHEVPARARIERLAVGAARGGRYRNGRPRMADLGALAFGQHLGLLYRNDERDPARSTRLVTFSFDAIFAVRDSGSYAMIS